MRREGGEGGDREGALEVTFRCSFCAVLCKHVESHREPLFWKEPRINCDVQAARQQALGLLFISSPSLSIAPAPRKSRAQRPPSTRLLLHPQGWQWKTDPVQSPLHHRVPSQRGVLQGWHPPPSPGFPPPHPTRGRGEDRGTLTLP